eukprot:2800387-Rhodomonas_salina.1
MDHGPALLTAFNHLCVLTHWGEQAGYKRVDCSVDGVHERKRGVTSKEQGTVCCRVQMHCKCAASAKVRNLRRWSFVALQVAEIEAKIKISQEEL